MVPTRPNGDGLKPYVPGTVLKVETSELSSPFSTRFILSISLRPGLKIETQRCGHVHLTCLSDLSESSSL